MATISTKYILRITAGPSYNPNTHVEVPVNTPNPIRIHHGLMDIELQVRINGYTGLPRNSPKTSPYFLAEPHATNDDRYSICFRFTPRSPSQSSTPTARSGLDSRSSSASPTNREVSLHSLPDGSKASSISGSQKNGTISVSPTPVPITTAAAATTTATTVEISRDTVGQVSDSPEPIGIPATDLHFGNDFAHPIRDSLPPGFNTAMGIVKWWIDPGLEGDAYSDTPHLYGPLLSSLNIVHVGEGQFDEERGGLWFEEGGDESGVKWRKDISAPDTGGERMRWALRNDSKEAWVWEWGRTYGADFFNPYLDFADFRLRLPGFSLPLIQYIDSGPQPRRSHHLRYVLRNRTTGDTYMVIVFTLHRHEDVNEDGSLRPVVQVGADSPPGHSSTDSESDKGDQGPRELLVQVPEMDAQLTERAASTTDSSDVD